MNAVTGLLLLTLTGADLAAQPEPCPKQELYELTLSQALRLGLGNAKVMRVVCERIEEDGQVYVTIAPASDLTGSPQFRAEAMALVRTVEQRYWSLAQHQAQLRASEQAVATARGVLEREQAELKAGRGTVADVAEAEQRLEQLKVGHVAKTSDLITTERELREVVGLPPADNRRIVPVTEPVKQEVKPDWKTCLATMTTTQPNITQQRMMVCAAGLRYLVARGPALLSHLGLRPEDAATTGDAQHALSSLRHEQALLQDVVHQTTHSLARLFLEVDANYKQLKTASRLRAAAAQRLEAQRAFYEEDRIPIDRYLDAVAQHASAAAQEAEFQTNYNVSLIALEEGKGTLLAYRHVAIQEPIAAAERQATSSVAPARTVDPDVKQTGAETEPSPAPAPARNVSFDITIGEVRPIRVRGTISITPGH